MMAALLALPQAAVAEAPAEPEAQRPTETDTELEPELEPELDVRAQLAPERSEEASEAAPPAIDFFDLPRPEPLQDPIARASLAMTAVGVAAAIAGAATWLSSEPGAELHHDAGTTLFGAGAGVAVSGGIGLLVSLTRPLRPDHTRDMPGLAVAGLVFADLGAGALGAALTLGGLSQGGADFGRAAPLYVVSGISGLLGLTFLVIGADSESPTERAVEQQKRQWRAERDERERVAKEKTNKTRGKKKAPRRIRPGLLGSGIATLLGGTATAVGSFVGIAKGDLSGAGGWFLGISHLAAGLGAGIPLTVAGSRPGRHRAPPRPPPTVSVGPGTVHLTLTF